MVHFLLGAFLKIKHPETHWENLCATPSGLKGISSGFDTQAYRTELGSELRLCTHRKVLVLTSPTQRKLKTGNKLTSACVGLLWLPQQNITDWVT